jgi:pyruvate/2-oxoglutarate dehydrogenase complex dihydrolipoamide acyltransferase (E2) component
VAKMSELERNKILPYSKGRLMIAEATRQSKYYSHIQGILEVDVTRPLEIMETFDKKTGERISFTAWVIKCVAKAVTEFPIVQTFRFGRNKMLEFHDVDVKTNIEKNIDGRMIPLQYIIRKANEKSLREIHDEIRQAQKHTEDQRIRERKIKRQQRKLMRLPVWVRSFFWRGIMTNPYKIKKNLGTIGVTAVGMFGQGLSGWIFPITPHSSTIAIGAIVKKPVYIENKFEPRDILHITIVVNHDVVDGGPAVRFGNRLQEIMKDAYGLDEFIVE